jgi:hypothetical protein
MVERRDRGMKLDSTQSDITGAEFRSLATGS